MRELKVKIATAYCGVEVNEDGDMIHTVEEDDDGIQRVIKMDSSPVMRPGPGFTSQLTIS